MLAFEYIFVYTLYINIFLINSYEASMLKDPVIQLSKFKDIDINVPFFNDLKNSYSEFTSWKKKKRDETVFVTYDNDNNLIGFMYLKIENGPIVDISPSLNDKKVLKVGTFKIEAHGTKLSDRYIKKIFDMAIANSIKYVYVTVFEKHEKLIKRLCEYGFIKYGEKITDNGREEVFLKNFVTQNNNIYLDYPVVNVQDNNIWLLGIYPEYHTKLFPDSALRTENHILNQLINDVTPANSIKKIYIARMQGMEQISRNDVVVIYRTAEKGKSAEYSSVATSICIVDKNKSINSFKNIDEFLDYSKYSIFSEKELKIEFANKNNYVIKMTYNVALDKRITRHDLIEKANIDREAYAGLMQMTKEQFKRICELGGVSEGLIIY